MHGHNEARNHLHGTGNPKKVNQQHINQILTKVAPTESDLDSHSSEFDVLTDRTITAIRCGNATTAAQVKKILLCSQTLASNSATPPEQQTLGLADSPEGSSNHSSIVSQDSTNNSINSTSRVCLEIHLIQSHQILMQSSSNQPGNVWSKERWNAQIQTMLQWKQESCSNPSCNCIHLVVLCGSVHPMTVSCIVCHWPLKDITLMVLMFRTPAHKQVHQASKHT